MPRLPTALAGAVLALLPPSVSLADVVVLPAAKDATIFDDGAGNVARPPTPCGGR
jgi:hypothetical protein